MQCHQENIHTYQRRRTTTKNTPRTIKDFMPTKTNKSKQKGTFYDNEKLNEIIIETKKINNSLEMENMRLKGRINSMEVIYYIETT